MFDSHKKWIHNPQFRCKKKIILKNRKCAFYFFFIHRSFIALSRSSTYKNNATIRKIEKIFWLFSCTLLKQWYQKFLKLSQFCRNLFKFKNNSKDHFSIFSLKQHGILYICRESEWEREIIWKIFQGCRIESTTDLFDFWWKKVILILVKILAYVKNMQKWQSYVVNNGGVCRGDALT